MRLPTVMIALRGRPSWTLPAHDRQVDALDLGTEHESRRADRRPDPRRRPAVVLTSPARSHLRAGAAARAWPERPAGAFSERPEKALTPAGGPLGGWPSRCGHPEFDHIASQA